MKTSRLVSMVIVLAATTLVGCGKKDSSSSSNAVCNTNINCSNFIGGAAQITDRASIVNKINELNAIFINKSLIEGVNPVGFQETVFFSGGVQSSSSSFLGLFNFTSSSWQQDCTFTRVAVNGNGLNIARASNSCRTQNGQLVIPTLPALTAYDPSTNDDLEDALNNNPQQIFQRGAVWNGGGSLQGQYQAYTIITSRNFDSEIIEYTVVPGLPTYLNPVASRNITTGSVRQLQGIQLF